MKFVLKVFIKKIQVLLTKPFQIKVLLTISKGGTSKSLAPPKYDYQGEGKVVVEITVDPYWKSYRGDLRASKDRPLWMNTCSALLRRQLSRPEYSNSKSDAPAFQKGTITYNFVLK